MFAIVEVKGEQLIIEKGKEYSVPRLDVDKPGEKIEFDQVLLYSDDNEVKVGTPYVDKVSVIAKFLNEEKDEKIRVFKYKRRKGYRNTKGHRQKLSAIKIVDIKAITGKASGSSVSETVPKADKPISTVVTKSEVKKTDVTAKTKTDTVKAEVKETKKADTAVKAKTGTTKEVKKTDTKVKAKASADKPVEKETKSAEKKTTEKKKDSDK